MNIYTNEALVHLAKTIRLDISEVNIFTSPADPDELAVTGIYSYVGVDYKGINSKE